MVHYGHANAIRQVRNVFACSSKLMESWNAKIQTFQQKSKRLSLTDLSQINYLKRTLPSYRYNYLYYFNLKMRWTHNTIEIELAIFCSWLNFDPLCRQSSMGQGKGEK